MPSAPPSLAKADLVSGMVGEFPELQGVMGRYYALDQEENPIVADAIAAHYKPLGPSDEVPREPVAIAVALADKLDMLVGFWAIDEKPTGSKDPYALRRAALGVIRIVLENDLRPDLWLRLRNLALGWQRHFADIRSEGAFEALLAMPVYIKATPEFEALLDKALFADAVRGIARTIFFRCRPNGRQSHLASSPTGSRCIFAIRARGTIWSMRCSRSAATIC